MHQQGREQTPSFPSILAGAWRDSSHSVFQPSKTLNMKQKHPRAFTNEPQQAGCRYGFMGCWGVNISCNYKSEKSLHSSSSCLFHTSLAAGLPNASFRPMPVKKRISRHGPPGSHFKPLAWVPTPCARVRQTGLCVPGAG